MLGQLLFVRHWSRFPRRGCQTTQASVAQAVTLNTIIVSTPLIPCQTPIHTMTGIAVVSPDSRLHRRLPPPAPTSPLPLACITHHHPQLLSSHYNPASKMSIAASLSTVRATRFLQTSTPISCAISTRPHTCPLRPLTIHVRANHS